MIKKRKTLPKKKNKIPRRITVKKRRKRGRGPEEEVPFLLKSKLRDFSFYEPGITQKIMSHVPKNSITKTINRAELMKNYKKFYKDKKEQREKNKEILLKWQTERRIALKNFVKKWANKKTRTSLKNKGAESQEFYFKWQIDPEIFLREKNYSNNPDQILDLPLDLHV